jgi:hypothetical protein
VETDQKKLFLAVAFLVLALGVLGFQVFRRIDRDARETNTVAEPGVMMEALPSSAAEPTAAWIALADYGGQLDSNPFLRPKGAAGKSASSGGARRSSSRVPTNLRINGVRTGPIPTVIVNDRTRRVGDEIAGWRIVSIERDRVTLRSSDGRTIRLDAR